MLTTILLAFVQSMTEFLPISSSGHLFLVSAFGVSHNGLAMDVALHVGTLLAVLVYFYRDIWRMMLFKDMRLMSLLIVATLPVVCLGLCCGNMIENIVRAPIMVAICSIIFGLLLWFVDVKSKAKKTIQTMTMKDAFLIGCAQICALIPGVSRSGITMTMGRGLGLKREDCAHFSMLLSIPTIFGAMVYVLYKNFNGELVLPSALDLEVGILCAALFGLLAIAFLMRWLKHASFFVFAAYRVVLGLVVLIYFM